MLSAVNSVVLALMNQLGVSNMAAQIRLSEAQPADAPCLILCPLRILRVRAGETGMLVFGAIINIMSRGFENSGHEFHHPAIATHLTGNLD